MGVQEWGKLRPSPKKVRFAVSLTALLKSNSPPGSSPGPEADVVDFCKEMFKQGHHITVLSPASGLLEDQEVVPWLNSNGIKYHEVELGGDSACDFIIHNHAIDPLLGSLEKQTGFYFGGFREESSAPGTVRNARQAGSNVGMLGL